MTQDLGFEAHEAETGRRARYGRRRAAVAAILVAVLAIVAGLAYAGDRVAHRLFGAPPDYAGPGAGSVVVQVHAGDTLTQIGVTLLHDGVVRSVGAFTDAASANSNAQSIGPGFYRLRRHMKATLAVALLLNPSSLIEARVTIPEGWRLRDIFAALTRSARIPLADLKTAAADPASLGVPSWGAGHPLEGFCFPATYDFAPGTTAKQALSAMVQRFDQATTSIGLVAGARRIGYTPYQVLTLASIIEREGRLTSDFPRIAEVFYNRLARKMPLGSDAVLYYILPPNNGPLRQSQLALDSPYNTRLHAGLPPTPIASPGEAALQAALHPAHGNLLYFVTIDKAGHAAFATTLTQFNRLVAESRARGVR